MRSLSQCQASLTRVVVQKVDRRSKSIKKAERTVSESLRGRKINLEEENFEILDILQQCAQSVRQGSSSEMNIKDLRIQINTQKVEGVHQ